MATTRTGAVLGVGAFTYDVSGDDWGTLPDGWSYKEATAVAVDSKDNAYVFNRGEHPMIVLDRDGNLVREWGHGVFGNPHGVSVGPDDSIYCADSWDHTIRKFTPEGKLLMTLGTKDRPAPVMSGEPFNAPTHLAVDPRNGDMYVADGYGNARVHKYDPDGRLLLSWGASGTDPGEFSIVHNIAVDRDGWVYVADRENRRVQVFDSNGKFETRWGNLSRAAAICVDRSDDQLVYVGEYYAGISSNETGLRLGPRVTVFDRGGTVLARLGDEPMGPESGRFYFPHGIAVDSHGDIYVAEVPWIEIGRHMDPPRELRSLQKLVKKSS